MVKNVKIVTLVGRGWRLREFTYAAQALLAISDMSTISLGI